MLLRFSFSNFRAFRELQTLDMAAKASDKMLPENVISPNLPGLKNERFLKGIALYGANASGKTTVLEAMSVLAHLVRDSASTTDPKSPVQGIESFVLDDKSVAEPTAFAIMFVADDVRYDYRLAVTREKVIHESLSAFPKGKEQLWFSRQWNSEAKKYVWSPDGSSIFKRDHKEEGFTLPNALYVSTATKLNNVQIEPVYRWFKDRFHVIDLEEARTGFNFSARQLIRGTPLAEKILALLRHADLGITSANAEEKALATYSDDEAKALNLSQEVLDRLRSFKRPQVQFFHKGEAQRIVMLPWDAESAGTRKLFSFSGPWLDILEKGYTACVDELDTSLHPLITMALLRIFFSELQNRQRAQIIFCSHNPLLLDPTLIRRDQVWFAEKDDEGCSHLYPLTAFSPRKGESLARGYLTGRYGAVPFIPEDLARKFSEDASRQSEIVSLAE
jgi:hypothetical protein